MDVSTYTQVPANVVVCPRCQRPTDRLKRYSVWFLIFGFVFFVTRFERAIACPRCMRRLLLKRAFQELFLANLAAPLVWFWYFLLLLGTTTKGHSSRRLALAHEQPASSDVRRSADDDRVQSTKPPEADSRIQERPD